MATWTALLADWTSKAISIARMNAYLSTSGNMQYIKDRMNIGARVYNDADIEIAHNTLTDLTFNSERWDTDGMHSLLSNTGRLTCVTAGKYLVIGNVTWEASDAGKRALQIYLNGATIIGSVYHDVDSAMNHKQCVSTIYDLGVGDYLTLNVFQDSGGALDVKVLGNYSPEFMCQWIGE